MTIDTITGVSEPFDETDDAPQGRRTSGLGMTALVLASLGIAGLALYRDPGVRAVVRDVAADPRVRTAAGELRKSVGAAWRDHGGPEAMASAVRRSTRIVRP